MMIPIDKSSNIFDSEAFVSEEVLFNLMHLIRDDENAIVLKSENEKVIIAHSSEQRPVWIWSHKNIEEQNYQEIADDFYQLFSNRNTLKIVAKPQLAEFLSKDYAKRRNIDWRIAISLEAYQCQKIVYPSNVSGLISNPSLEDVDIISNFLVGFVQDCFGLKTTKDKQIETAKSYIASGNFYVWKVDNEIVSMANIAHRSSRHGRINEVYTPPSHRKKRYAGALVSELSRIIQSENRTPVLYTDLSNPASNKAYTNVGFVKCGSVNQINFEFQI